MLTVAFFFRTHVFALNLVYFQLQTFIRSYYLTACWRFHGCWKIFTTIKVGAVFHLIQENDITNFYKVFSLGWFVPRQVHSEIFSEPHPLLAWKLIKMLNLIIHISFGLRSWDLSKRSANKFVKDWPNSTLGFTELQTYCVAYLFIVR